MEALLVIFCTIMGLSAPAVAMLLLVRYKEFVKALHAANETKTGAEKMLTDLKAVIAGLSEKHKEQQFRIIELEQILAMRGKK